MGRPSSEQAQPAGSGRPAEDRAAGAAPTEEEVAARLRELTEELVRTPAAVVVANHAMGLYELAALHLTQKPPNLAEARLAIDALGALVEGLGGRLGESEPALREFLARIRLAFVQATSTAGKAGGTGPSGGAGPATGADAPGEAGPPPPSAPGGGSPEGAG